MCYINTCVGLRLMGVDNPPNFNDYAIDRFSTFDQHQDVKVGMVVAMKTDGIDQHLRIPFCGKGAFFKSTSL